MQTFSPGRGAPYVICILSVPNVLSNRLETDTHSHSHSIQSASRKTINSRYILLNQLDVLLEYLWGVGIEGLIGQ